MQKFPEDIQCIIDPVQNCGGVYISNIEAAENPHTLKKYGIEAVITAIKGKNLDKKIPVHIEYLYIPAVDHQGFDISYYFQQANQFIHDQRRRTNVLVHCMAGISRSVTLLIAYMMKFMDETYHNAYNFVKQKRKIIHPNDSFIQQLQKYQAKLKKLPLADLSNNTQNYQKICQNNLKTSSFHQTRIPRKSENCQNNYDQKLKSSIRAIFQKKQKQNSTINA